MHGVCKLTISVNFLALPRLVGGYEVVQLVRPSIAPTCGTEIESIILIARGRGKGIDDFAQRMIPVGVRGHLNIVPCSLQGRH
jgi:hypothetical protein